MANATAITLSLLLFFTIPFSIDGKVHNKRRVVEVEGSPDDLVWAVQLSDLHFSVHHPLRARDFRDFVGPALSFINPSLVLLTGDLTGPFLPFFRFGLMGLVLCNFVMFPLGKDLSCFWSYFSYCNSLYVLIDVGKCFAFTSVFNGE